MTMTKILAAAAFGYAIGSIQTPNDFTGAKRPVFDPTPRVGNVVTAAVAAFFFK